MRTQEIVEAYGKTHIYMIGMDDNPQPKHIDVIIKNVKHDNIFSGGKRHYEIEAIPARRCGMDRNQGSDKCRPYGIQPVDPGRQSDRLLRFGRPVLFRLRFHHPEKPFRSRHESVSLLQLIADVRTP